MASTTYLTRVIYKEHSSTLTGTYNLLLAAKSVPTPLEAPNTVESTTFEDAAQTFEIGVKQSGSKEITGNLSKEYLDAITALEGETLDIMFLYGTDGVGGVAKYLFQGAVAATPSDAGGVDEILEMTATVVPSTVPELVTDDYSITDNDDGTFTVSTSTSA